MTAAQTEAGAAAGGGRDVPPRSYKYYELLMAGFVAVLLCSNLIGPGKVCVVWGLRFGAGTLFFPISYILGDVLTEVYGYARARRVIWAGFGAMLFATIMSFCVRYLPLAPGEPYNAALQQGLDAVFGNTWRVAVASLVAFWAGDFANSYVLAKMKLLTRGRFLWTRTIGSTIVGEGVDSALFFPIAFAGIWATGSVLSIVLFNWVFKVLVEVVATPLTYLIINALKRAEREDFYDRGTRFTPFALEV